MREVEISVASETSRPLPVAMAMSPMMATKKSPPLDRSGHPGEFRGSHSGDVKPRRATPRDAHCEDREAAVGHHDRISRARFVPRCRGALRHDPQDGPASTRASGGATGAPAATEALEWSVEAGQADIGLRMATALWRFWQQRGPLWEGRRELGRALSTPGSSPGIRGKALGAASGLAWWDGDFEATRAHAEAALPLVIEGGDQRAEIAALYDLGFALMWSGVLHGGMEVDRPEELMRRSLSLAEQFGDRKGIAKAVPGTGMVIGIARGHPLAFQRSRAHRGARVDQPRNDVSPIKVPRRARIVLIGLGSLLAIVVAVLVGLSLVYSPVYVVRSMVWQEADVGITHASRRAPSTRRRSPSPSVRRPIRPHRRTRYGRRPRTAAP